LALCIAIIKTICSQFF